MTDEMKKTLTGRLRSDPNHQYCVHRQDRRGDVMNLEMLYVLINEDRTDEALDYILDVYYEDENPMDEVFRTAQDMGFIGGEPIPPPPNKQLERIDLFLSEVDLDKLSLGVSVGIIMFSFPYLDELNNIKEFVSYYKSKYKEELEKRPGLRFDNELFEN